MKRPSFQFYPGDWMSNPALRMCSLAARGLWTDMMSIMHDCTPYGHLVVNGKGILSTHLARRVGATIGETEELLAELKEHGVYAVSSDGWIFSPRMVRDEHNRNVRAAGGVESLRNPSVPRPKDSLKQRSKDAKKDTFRPSPSSPSPSPSSSPPSSSSLSPNLLLKEFEGVWTAYPKRAGPNSKQAAYDAYKEARKAGTSAAEILEGVHRYAKYIRATGREGTEYVKMVSTFLGPNKCYADAWEVPAPEVPTSSAPAASRLPRGKTLAATKLIAHVREKRNPMHPHSAIPDWHHGLSDFEREVVRSFGLQRILTDTNDGTLVSQLAKALEECDGPQGESASPPQRVRSIYRNPL